MKLKLLLIILVGISFFSLSFSDSNGIWTSAEDIVGGEFGADETVSNFTFNDIVYFNQDLVYKSTRIEDLFVNRSGDSMSGDLDMNNNNINNINTITTNASTPDYLGGVFAEYYFTRGGGISYYLRPANTSVINNLEVVNGLEYGGIIIDNVFVNEGQANSISSGMIIDGTITTDDINVNNFTNKFATKKDLEDISFNSSSSTDINYITNNNSILNSCEICRRYADNNGRASASWDCASFGNELLTDFVGDVDFTDDFDLKVECSDSEVESSYELCRRYADNNRISSSGWTCKNFGDELLTDFVGNVDSNDEFLLAIKPRDINNHVISNCGLCSRYADNNNRANSGWRCSKIGNALSTKFQGDVDYNDDFDLKLSCDIVLEG